MNVNFSARNSECVMYSAAQVRLSHNITANFDQFVNWSETYFATGSERVMVPHCTNMLSYDIAENFVSFIEI